MRGAELGDSIKSVRIVAEIMKKRPIKVIKLGLKRVLIKPLLN